MNHRTFTRLLTEGKVWIEIVKDAQVYGYRDTSFLTNRSNHPYATYPVVDDASRHLNPGDTLEVLKAMSPNSEMDRNHMFFFLFLCFHTHLASMFKGMSLSS